MTKAWKRRRARRQLVNHDRGLDRHNKALSFQQKSRRKASDRSFKRKKRSV